MMMPFHNLDARGRRVIGYATLTYIFAVTLLLAFARAALAAPGPATPAEPTSPLPVEMVRTIERSL